MQDNDIKKLVNNIKCLAKARSIKITELEKNAAVSQGYLSRIESSDYTTRPNIVIVKSMADTLGVGVNVLLEYDLSSIADDLLLMLNKLDKIKNMTDSDLLDWNHTTEDVIIQKYYDSKEYNPLYTRHSNGSYEYTSIFNDYIHEVNYDILFYQFNNNWYYLTKFKFNDDYGRNYYNFEFYVKVDGDKTCEGICSGYSYDIIGEALDSLYDSAYDNSRRIKLNEKIKKCLEDF